MLRHNSSTERALKTTDRDPLAKRLAAVYGVHRDNPTLAFDDARQAIESAAETHRVGIVSNGEYRFSGVGLEEYIDAVVSAPSFQRRKANGDLFRDALGRCAVRPHDVVHVGDSLEDDVAGAQAAGIPAIWLNRAGRRSVGVQPDAEIMTLLDLRAAASALVRQD